MTTIPLESVELRNVEGDNTCFEIRTVNHSVVVCAYTTNECARWKNEIMRQDSLKPQDSSPTK